MRAVVDEHDLHICLKYAALHGHALPEIRAIAAT